MRELQHKLYAVALTSGPWHLLLLHPHVSLYNHSTQNGTPIRLIDIPHNIHQITGLNTRLLRKNSTLSAIVAKLLHGKKTSEPLQAPNPLEARQ